MLLAHLSDRHPEQRQRADAADEDERDSLHRRSPEPAAAHDDARVRASSPQLAHATTRDAGVHGTGYERGRDGERDDEIEEESNTRPRKRAADAERDAPRHHQRRGDQRGAEDPREQMPRKG